MPSDTQHMTCMEVWGGNAVVDTAVNLSGLDAWVYSKPYANSSEGGDVHYVSSCATGRITRLLIADVSGHGDKVSATAAELRNLMRKFVNQIDQTRFVMSMNQQFATLARVGTFATALVTTFFAPTSTLSLSNAGHPPPFLYRAKANEWSILDAKHVSTEISNIPLGIEDVAKYTQFDTQLDVGDWVLCYTDSLIESHNPDGSMLGSSGLLSIVQGIPCTDPACFIPALLAKIAALNPINLTEDDVTLLLFRPTTTHPRVALREKLAATKTFLASLLPGGPPTPWPEFTLANFGGALFRPLSQRWHGRNRAQT